MHLVQFFFLIKDTRNLFIVTIRSYWQHGLLWLSFLAPPYQSLPLACPLHSIHYLHRADWCRFLLVNLHWCVHRRMSLRSLSLILQQSPACLVHLTWIVCVIGSKWLYCCFLVWYCLQDLFSRQHKASLCSFHLAFSLSMLLEYEWCFKIIKLCRPHGSPWLFLGTRPYLLLFLESPLHSIHALLIDVIFYWLTFFRVQVQPSSERWIL